MEFESLVMKYLAAQGLFLSPQFSIREGNKEWSCPDFVALDFRNHEIQVVEITTAYDVTNLMKKVRQSEQQWFQRLRPQLIALGVPADRWRNSIRAFVRRERCEYFKARLATLPEVRVEVTAIEDITFPWAWPWDEWKTGSNVLSDNLTRFV